MEMNILRVLMDNLCITCENISFTNFRSKLAQVDVGVLTNTNKRFRITICGKQIKIKMLVKNDSGKQKIIIPKILPSNEFFHVMFIDDIKYDEDKRYCKYIDFKFEDLDLICFKILEYILRDKINEF